MNTISELELVCNPILTRVCNYWQLVSIGSEPSKEQFQNDIENLLMLAKEKANRDPALAHDYAKIERPLIFFIDYMVKEGKFPFRREWRELARNYNELSGDEKFFNLFFESLNDSEAGSAVMLFYIMFGLGFDGIYRSDPRYIEKCMQACAARLGIDFDIHAEPLVKIKPRKKAPSLNSHRLLTKHIVLIAAAIFMLGCFAINFFTFAGVTKDYRQALSMTVRDAVPVSRE
jgi:type VI protein secretion system component VasF